MTTRIHENLLKGIFYIILFALLLLQSLLTKAQSRGDYSPKTYKGFVATFATRSLTVSSNIAAIHESNLLQTGGALGLILGNNFIRSQVGLIGYYTSSGNTAGGTDLYESNVSVDFYPLSWISGKSMTIEPYVTGGLNYDRYKFYGFYLNQEPGTTNYSQATAPLLGKVKQLNATVGIGVEVRLKERFDFIHFFSEATYGHNLSTRTKDTAFSETTLQHQTQVVVGIAFGSIR